MKNTLIKHANLMDGVYRWIKYIYDPTRFCFLFGRNTLLNELAQSKANSTLEIGSGTARNLIYLHLKKKNIQLYGIDASKEMLALSKKKIALKGLENSINLQFDFAEKVHFKNTFQRTQPFDSIFFSYSLSMIPDWKAAIKVALNNLSPKGILYIVDFWDQRFWPKALKKVFHQFLHKFHVNPRFEALDYLSELEERKKGILTIQSIKKHYAFFAKFQLQNSNL